jgi:hypothetical protein
MASAKGFAAVRSYQSGARGVLELTPAFSREIETIGRYHSASRRHLRFSQACEGLKDEV